MKKVRTPQGGGFDSHCRLYGRRFYRSDDPSNSVKALKEGG